jgi:enoyl-CoA hydratase
MTSPASYSIDGPIATITIDDGKVNALSIATLEAVHEALDRADDDGAVVLLTGRPGCFSAGFDLAGFTAQPSEVVRMLTLGATLAERLLARPRPTVVACNGHAVAAGSFMLLAADVRIGADGPYQIGLNEVRIGITMPWFAIELARQRLHPAHYDRAVVCSAMYEPRAALAAGFLDVVVTPEQLDHAGDEAARTLAELSPAAHAATKQRARAAALAAIRHAIETELTVESLSGQPAPV